MHYIFICFAVVSRNDSIAKDNSDTDEYEHESLCSFIDEIDTEKGKRSEHHIQEYLSTSPLTVMFVIQAVIS